MRICIVYDCLYPWTVGGAERWYRNLAERLAQDGHEVTYITLRQWDRGKDPSYAGVRVRSVGPRMALYTGARRRILPPLVFGAGVLAHLARHGGRYDVVHTHSPLLASGARLATIGTSPRPALVTTEHNAWSTFALPTRVVNAFTAPRDDVTIAVSDQVRRSMWWPGTRRRCEVLVHGIDLAAAADVVRTSGSGPASPKAAFAAGAASALGLVAVLRRRRP